MTARTPFNFDAWKQLAQTDPAAFELRRSRRIESEIGTLAGERARRVRGLQFRIDMERRRSRSPLGACMRIHKMMLEQLESRFQPALTGSLASRLAGRTVAAPRSADIIPLRKPRHNPDN